MSGEMELDPKALEVAARALSTEHYRSRFAAAATAAIVVRNVDANWRVFLPQAETASRAYLRAAGLVSVPVIGRKG